MTIDWNFIAGNEGADITTGYVPNPDTSQSGVTIASGFDLGQINLAGLDELVLDPDLAAKLRPYVGLKRQDAVAALATQPLVLSLAQVEAIDAAVESQHGAEIRQHYNAFGGDWDGLPDAAQTAIADLAFQYGTALDHETPHFWHQALNCDWAGMYANLMAFGDAYPNRRHAEAALLKPLIGVA